MSRDKKQDGVEQGVAAAGEGGFLNRWSRLKRERETFPQLAPEASPPSAIGQIDAELAQQARPAEIEAAQAEVEAGIERKRAELIAGLPQLDTITATTDVTGFMNALIPDALRNAGLRAAWSADPAIRDFLNDAREYALDYNTPGAAYGYGPLTESDLAGLDDMVRGIFGDKPKQDNVSVEVALQGDDTLVCDHTDDASGISDISSQSNSVASQQLQPPGEDPHSVRLSAVLEEYAETPAKHQKRPEKQARLDHQSGPEVTRAVQQDAHDATATCSNVTPYRRRGGGAMPQ